MKFAGQLTSETKKCTASGSNVKTNEKSATLPNVLVQNLFFYRALFSAFSLASYSRLNEELAILLHHTAAHTYHTATALCSTVH